MRFPSMLRRLRNTQGGGTRSTPSNLYPYCPYLPGMTEPPWLTEARKYVVTNDDTPPTSENPPPTSDGRQPTHETWKDGPGRILDWVGTVRGVDKTQSRWKEKLKFDVTDDGWCAAFLGAVLAESELAHTSTLRARDYENWGKDCGDRIGAIAVFERHVAFVTKTGGKQSGEMLGGNQSDAVNIQPQGYYEDFIGYRWPSECPCPGEASESGEANGQSSQ